MFGRDKDEQKPRRFVMREEMFSIGDDYWIEDDGGNRVYRVDGKALRLRDTFVLEDASGREVGKIQERKLSLRDKMAIERDGHTIATVRTAMGWGDRYAIEVDGGKDLKAHGHIGDHEYDIERDGDRIARVSKKWFRVRETYGVEIGPNEDLALLLSVVVAIERMSGGGKD
jgi:uncharacterized protein YxjI